MPQSFAHLAVHLVFSAKNREPILNAATLPKLHAYFVGIIKGLNCTPIQIGGVADHVHLLFALSRTRAIADVTRELKTNSTNWLHTQSPRYNQFHWQVGYGVFSVSASTMPDVKSYIVQQPEHHRKVTFQDEYRALLAKHGIAYDERYMWD